MELSDFVGAQFAFHGIVVGFVIILAVLVFAFGFKTAEEPPFDKLTNTSDDRKPAGKKRKVKDKKSQSNGHATTVVNEKSEPKNKSAENTPGKAITSKPGSKLVKDDKRESDKVNVKEPVKSGKQEKKQQKSDVVVKPALKENKNIKDNKNELKPLKKQDQGSKDSKTPTNKSSRGKENVAVEAKNKKNTEKTQKSKKIEEKPQDYDEGEWEQASYRKDRKKTRTNIEEEVSGDKTGEKKEPFSPSKKKSGGKISTPTPTTALSEVTDFIEGEKKTVKKDNAKKEKKSTQQSEEVSDFLAAESEAKVAGSKKSEKKKGGKNEAESIVSAEKIEVEISAKITEVAAPKVIPEPVKKVVDDNAAVFDELADACPEKWKEPKTSKKSNNRKKVRKDQ